METTSLYHSHRGPELEYDSRLRFQMENLQGAKIYKDTINRLVAKIEDHSTIFDPAPWVNFQGDRYVGRDGSMYVLTENPNEVNKLGCAILRETNSLEEGPPSVGLLGFKLVNSIWVCRILLDDNSKILYKQENHGSKFFYMRNCAPDYTITEDKILYIFVQESIEVHKNVIYLDKFGLEWEMILPGDLKDLTYLGESVVRYEREKRTPIPTLSFKDPSTTGTSGLRPKTSRSMHVLSGHLAIEVPTRPLQSTPVHSMGTPTRNKTRPSHFQKWVKKFNGTGDPYDHLASFKQVARAEVVLDLHVLKEGFGLTLEGKALSWFQTLDIGTYHSIESLEKDFLESFTKT